MSDFVFPDAPFVLFTMHRRESRGKPMEEAFTAIREMVREMPELHVVFPMHPNPEVSGLARRIFGESDRVHLCPPFAYPKLVEAMMTTALVMTDSGGLQEEAPTFDKHVLILRENTDRQEAVEAGMATVVGTTAERILPEARRHLAPALALHRAARRIMEDYDEA